MEEKVQQITEDFDSTLNDANKLIWQLETKSNAMVAVEKEVRKVEGDIQTMLQETGVSQAADLIRAMEGDPSVTGLVSRVARLEAVQTTTGGVGCASPRIASGKTDTNGTPWIQYLHSETIDPVSNGTYTNVDTSNAGFAETPMYFVIPAARISDS